jgi:hypothetical protein
MRTQGRGLVLVLGVVLIAGCGDPNARRAVSGTVSLNGRPLDQGSIYFAPIGQGSSEAGATIENGKYSIPRDVGLVPGTYKVSIFSYDRGGAKVQSEEIPGEPGATQFKERIPRKYNADSKLTAEVTASGKNVFDFNLD